MSVSTASVILATATVSLSVPTCLESEKSASANICSNYLENTPSSTETRAIDNRFIIKESDDALSLFQKLRTICQNAMIEDQKLFYELHREWHMETALNSDSMQSVIAKPYQRIIGMGKRALPFIFKELPKCRDNWFWALEAITGENPVKPEHYSSFKSSIQDWALWGEEHGFNC